MLNTSTDTHWSHIRVERQSNTRTIRPAGNIWRNGPFFSLSLSFLSFFAFFSLHHFSIIFREAYLACWHRAVYSNSVNRMDHGMEMSQDFVMNQILSRESWLVCCRQWTQWLQEEKSGSRLRHLYAAQKDWILFLSFSQTTKLAT